MEIRRVLQVRSHTTDMSITLVGDDRMLLSAAVCWFDQRLLGQTQGRADDQHQATRGEGPGPPA